MTFHRKGAIAIEPRGGSCTAAPAVWGRWTTTLQDKNSQV